MLFASLLLVLAQDIFASQAEIAACPISGPAWSALVSDANEPLNIVLSDQNDKDDSYALAAALVYRRLGSESYRIKVQDALLNAIRLPDTSDDSLAWSRNVCAVVIAADLIDWIPPEAEYEFMGWANEALTRNLGGRSIVSTHEDRPNNWGTHAGASRVAIATYLGDQAEIARCAQVFKGWLGDRSSYAGFDWGDLSWQYDATKPVGINPPRSFMGGIMPDDQRRCGTFPASYGCQTNYTWEAMQGVLVQAIILNRAGYDTWRWQQFAIARAAFWLSYRNNQPPHASVNGSDDCWQSYVLNRAYPQLLRLPELTSAPPGKHVGYTDFLTSSGLWP